MFERQELEKIVNSRQWPQSIILECQERRITYTEFLKEQFAAPQATPQRHHGPRKPISDLTQSELIAELTELGTPENVAKLTLERHREFVETAARQWKSEKMSDKARGFGEWTLRELRKVAELKKAA
jgi:hypothetical protein